jgi:hypothetical protein
LGSQGTVSGGASGGAPGNSNTIINSSAKGKDSLQQDSSSLSPLKGKGEEPELKGADEKKKSGGSNVAGAVLGSSVNDAAKKKIKKKILISIIGAIGPVLPILLVVIIVFTGISAAVSTKETIPISEIGSVEELRVALKKRQISKEELDDMMIDRRGLLKIVDAVCDWNSGKWHTDDRLTVKLNERTDDHYKQLSVVEGTVTSYADGFDEGGDNYGEGVLVSKRTIPRWDKKKKEWSYTDTYVVDEVFLSFSYRYSKELIGDDYEYVEDPSGIYVYDYGDYVICKPETIYHTYTEDVKETVTTHYDYTFDVSKTEKDYSKTSFGKEYVSSLREPAAKYGPDWEVKISTESLYIDYPVDWQTVYMLCVYHYIDKNDMEDVESDYEDGENEKIKIKKKDVEQIISDCMPKFGYAKVPDGESSIFSALSRRAKSLGDGDLFRAFNSAREIWCQKHISWWDSFSGGLKVSLSSQEVSGLYSSNNPVGSKLLLGGEPVAVTVYWTDSDIYDEYVSYGRIVRDKNNPVVHKSTIMVPYSTIEYVSTITGMYKYDPKDIKKFYTYDITKYQNAAGIDLGSNNYEGLKKELSDIASQRTAKPSGSYFELSRLRAMLGENRDIDLFATAIAELPNGETISSVLQCAEENEYKDVETSKRNFRGGELENVSGIMGLKRADVERY